MTLQEYKDALTLATLHGLRKLTLDEILASLDEVAERIRGDIIVRDLRATENKFEKQQQSWNMSPPKTEPVNPSNMWTSNETDTQSHDSWKTT